MLTAFLGSIGSRAPERRGPCSIRLCRNMAGTSASCVHRPASRGSDGSLPYPPFSGAKVRENRSWPCGDVHILETAACLNYRDPLRRHFRPLPLTEHRAGGDRGQIPRHQLSEVRLTARYPPQTAAERLRYLVVASRRTSATASAWLNLRASASAAKNRDNLTRTSKALSTAAVPRCFLETKRVLVRLYSPGHFVKLTRLGAGEFWRQPRRNLLSQSR